MTGLFASTVRPLSMALVAAGFLAAVAVNGAALAGDEKAKILDPWVRSAPPAMKMHAAYFVVMNPTGKRVDLIGADSPQYKMAELHLSKVEGGVATMVKQEQVSVPANGELAFAPGGFHVMLMHPRKPIRTGDTVDITLTFADGSSVSVSAPVRKTQDRSIKKRHGDHKMN